MGAKALGLPGDTRYQSAMKPLFLFGTLRFTPLLEAVLGRADHLDMRPAELPGFSVHEVAEGPFPMIRAAQAGVTQGVLISGLSTEDRAALEFYEAAFDNHLRPVTLAGGQAALAYLPQPELCTAQGAWSLEAWTRDWGEVSVLAAREAMSYRGIKTATQVAAMLPMIRARAWSRMNAATSLHGARTLPGKAQIRSRRRAYAHYFAVDDYELHHDRFDGTVSPLVARAVFLAPDAALVLPYDPIRDRVLLVEQMRMGPLARGDAVLWQLEPIAGRLDPGETPEAAARREALEEAGLTLGALEKVAETYCSPGTSSEFHYIYVGLAMLPDEAAGLGGLEAEDEDIRAHLLDFEVLMQMCETMQIANGPLVMASYWLARHRARLRAAAL